MMEYIKSFSVPCLRITYSGGEPLTYPGFQQVVEAATAHGYENQLLTNGILITESRAEFIGKHFTKVRISLDGPDRKSHAATRGDNFNQVLRGIRLMAMQETELTVQITLTKSNQKAAAAKLKELLPEGVRIAYTPMLPFGRAVDKQAEFITDDDFLDVSRTSVRNRGNVLSQNTPPAFLSSPLATRVIAISASQIAEMSIHATYSTPRNFTSVTSSTIVSMRFSLVIR